MSSPVAAHIFDGSPEKVRADQIVVFLGPSLTAKKAREILDAQYLAPARFGDVYRLIGSDVKTIVLIDGVFHGHAPVWPREILYALENGIDVYGASSMGALRAAELHDYGMSGRGTIFQWYLRGEIDGDDEVTLMHADAEHDYRALSEPLVNTRANLALAVGQGILDQDRAHSIVATLKALPFHERNRKTFWKAVEMACRNDDTVHSLREFFARQAIDRKRLDAVEVLTEIARKPSSLALDREHPQTTPSYHDAHRLLERRFTVEPDKQVRGRALVQRIIADPTVHKHVWCALSAQFFLRQWARERAVPMPDIDAVSFDQNHLSLHALTPAEYEKLWKKHLSVQWILDQPPERFGLSPVLQNEELLSIVPALEIAESVAPRARLARALPFVADWCRAVGATPGSSATNVLRKRWQPSLDKLDDGPEARSAFLEAMWALEKGPHHFGFTSWSFEAELIAELQMLGLTKVAAEGNDVKP